MSNYQVLSEQIDKLTEELKAAHQMTGALHVLVRQSIASVGDGDTNCALNALNMADQLILHGSINGEIVMFRGKS